ncbi:diphthine synthase [Candidatus Woesearchaeota archaeon CG10_big_fil_rev_8_21_14_0_10_34_12]|nr:MAG: diphthine synthase [Candidatus Woesearchaeota archaeon CG10_big_fil_rev_8_21_14_0_10_34_12]
MFYLIGLGLDLKSISLEAFEVLRKCKKIYLESYTVSFPYSVEELEKVIGKKITKLARGEVEDGKFVEDAGNEDVALLVYGSPLVATTHTSLILKCKKEEINLKVFNNASIFDAVAETGLHVYKFGKTASIPVHKADSFLDLIKENKKIKAHTLVLVDIGMKCGEALDRLKVKEKIVLCSRLGTDEQKIYYGKTEDLKGKKIEEPFCFIISAELHFSEQEFLDSLLQ